METVGLTNPKSFWLYRVDLAVVCATGRHEAHILFGFDQAMLIALNAFIKTAADDLAVMRQRFEEVAS